ncbi:hypothetical protein M407DRAFT_19740 [Tulasnella calospora MUT 4182]|uniref:Uncharacterized protein n=1 Tax=Tulasnella calospora MUT 4182 TaxID=1051891 RepID=A0A0C3LBV4_9AGAM|nr:hypothetical protein M407DRAFT_19740 [Tulasnella calospora MUT 4182]
MALRWHAKLDVSVQESWHLFVQALFEEYPLVELERDGGGIATPVWTATTFSPSPSNIALPGNGVIRPPHPIPQSPATETVPSRESQLSGPFSHGGELVSPHRVYDPSSTGYQMGRLRIVYEEGRPGPHYVWWDHEFSVDIKLKCVTSNIHEALIVGFIPSSEPHHIGSIAVLDIESWC